MSISVRAGRVGVQQQAPAGLDGGRRVGEVARRRRGDDRDVDRLAGVGVRAPALRELAAGEVRLADPHRLHAAGERGGDVQQARRAGAHHEQLVGAGEPGAVLGPEDGGEWADQRGGDRVDALQRQQLPGRAHLHVLGEAARLERGRMDRDRVADHRAGARADLHDLP